jgi:hypothetical protein
MFARLRGHHHEDEAGRASASGKVGKSQKELNELGLTDSFVADNAPRLTNKQIKELYEKVINPRSISNTLWEPSLWHLVGLDNRGTYHSSFRTV